MTWNELVKKVSTLPHVEESCESYIWLKYWGFYPDGVVKVVYHMEERDISLCTGINISHNRTPNQMYQIILALEE